MINLGSSGEIDTFENFSRQAVDQDEDLSNLGTGRIHEPSRRTFLPTSRWLKDGSTPKRHVV